jgi:glucokinase
MVLAKGMKDFIMITLGTGVGSGIVANGQLIYGHDGFAGELGHTIIIPDGRLHPGTGKKGSLESYASATGVAQSAMEILKTTDRPSLLRRNSCMTRLRLKMFLKLLKKMMKWLKKYLNSQEKS